MRIWIGLWVLAHAAAGEANERPMPPAAPPTSPPAAAPRRTPVAAPELAPANEPAASIGKPAPEPVDTRWYFDAMLGVGSEHLDLGLGVRGGKTLDNHLYLGGLLVYHLGSSASASAGGTMVTSSVSGFYLGPEAGYDVALEPGLVLRPYIGLGLAEASASSSAGTSASSSEVSIWPGVAAHYHLAGSNYDVGGDLRFVTGPWGTSVGLFVLGGMHFGS
ncbi:MAG: hypothetical protein ABI467_03570 [Kofleriaceae bacterium]